MFVLKTTLFYLVIVGIAMGVDDLQTVFNIVGAISANSLVFILPSLFYFRLVDLKKKRRTAKYFAAIGMFCFFILFGIFSVVSNLTIVNEK